MENKNIEKQVLDFIDDLKRPAEQELTIIYTQGGCFAFYELLKKQFPEAEPYKLMFANSTMYHVVSKIGEGYYDVTGQINTDIVRPIPMTGEDVEIAKKFRFPASRPAQEQKSRELTKREKIVQLLDYYRGTVHRLVILLFTAFLIPGYQLFFKRTTLNLTLAVHVAGFFGMLLIVITIGCLLLLFALNEWSFKKIEKWEWFGLVPTATQISYVLFAFLGFSCFAGSSLTYGALGAIIAYELFTKYLAKKPNGNSLTVIHTGGTHQ